MSFNENLNRMIQLASLQKYFFSNEKKSKVNYIKLSPEIKSNKSKQSRTDADMHGADSLTIPEIISVSVQPCLIESASGDHYRSANNQHKSF